MATPTRLPARRPGRAVALRPSAQVALRPAPGRRPVPRRPPRRIRRVHVRPLLRRHYPVRFGRRRQQVPGWVFVVGVVGLLLAANPVTGVPAVIAPAPPAPPAGLVCTTSAGGAVGPVAGFDGTQLAHAAGIVAAGKEMGVSHRGQVIAVATAMQESKIKIYANQRVPASMRIPHEAVGSDHDSVGPFQQRQTWGPTHVLMDPRGSARLFYDRLLRLRGWESMPLTVAAQRVQRSAHPTRYADDEGAAAAVVAAVADGITCTPTTKD
jgi:hypothetical protein